MLRLKNSRGLFFAKTREPQKSYWAHPSMVEIFEEARKKDGKEDGVIKIPSEYLNWDPSAQDSRSNCPILHETMKMLIELSSPKWRARANNIYAGRTYSNENMAASLTNLRGGMIAISHEYTSVLSAYAAMYGKFIYGLDYAKTITEEESRQLWTGMRNHFDKSIEEFKKGGLLALKGNPLMAFPDERYGEGFQGALFTAETWTVAHEFSHHMVRDVSTRRDREVVSILRDLTAKSSVGQEIRAMTADHRDEINADLLATLIMSGHFTDARKPMHVPSAISGAVLSLITIAHFREEWTSDREDTHPGCFDRIRILLTIICECFGKESAYPDDPERSHMLVRRMAGILITYAHWARGSIEMDTLSIYFSLADNSVKFDFLED